MTIAVCDDDEKIREILQRKVSEYCPDDTVEMYKTGEELLEAKRFPDILLLDIKMPGISGMETARRLRGRSESMILIFITGEDRYVFDSFDVHAFHYLVKPFSDEKLQKVLAEAKREYGRYQGKEEKRYVMILSGGRHIRLDLDKLVYAEVFDSRVLVHTLDSEVEYYSRLSALERTAGNDFFRTHRAYLVNMKYVIRYDSSCVWLEKGQALLSKKNYPKFVQAFMDYNRRKGSF